MKPSNVFFLRILALAFCLGLVGAPGKAFGQWLGFLRLEGVTGESTDTNHAGWMNIISGATSHLTKTNQTTALLNGPLCFEKLLDTASPILELRCAKKTAISYGTIDLTRTNTSLAQFLRLNLTNVVVSSVSDSGNAAGEERPFESICLSAQVMSWNYAQFNPANGLPRSYISSLWNFQSHTGSGGTNNPLFVVSGIRRTSGVELTWPAIAGKTYRIYGASQLNGIFTPLAEISAPVGGPGTMTNSQPSNNPSMFFIAEQAP
jgi:type VI secretion system secreted protein Hcp